MVGSEDDSAVKGTLRFGTAPVLRRVVGSVEVVDTFKDESVFVLLEWFNIWDWSKCEAFFLLFVDFSTVCSTSCLR